GLNSPLKGMFPDLASCSFDKNFYSPANKIELSRILDNVILPKKGRLSEGYIEEKNIENSEEFLPGKRKHSAVESGINALKNQLNISSTIHVDQGLNRVRYHRKEFSFDHLPLMHGRVLQLDELLLTMESLKTRDFIHASKILKQQGKKCHVY
ncbi:unnamed protein product, partial [marine sediment metagenome]